MATRPPGRNVFKAKCAECHASDSKEVKEGPGLQGVKDGKLPSGRKATHDVILDLVNKGQDAMPPFKDVLTDRRGRRHRVCDDALGSR